MPDSNPTRARLAQALQVLLFCALLLAPLAAVCLAPSGDSASAENRGLAPAPDPALLRSSPSAYFSAFEAWHNDRFGLRRELIRWNNLLRLSVFAESPVKGVRLGQGRWLFNADEWAFEDYENVMPIKAADLDSIAAILEERRAWLEARGIAFYVMVAPNKHTVYPEHLPPSIRKLGPESRLDQVAARLAKEPRIEFLDLRPALFAAKPQARLYDYTDSHWNEYGAFIGLRELMARVAKRFPGAGVPALDDYQVVTRDLPGGDLAGLLSLKDVLREDKISLVLKTPAKARDGVRDYPDPVEEPGRAMVVKETGLAGAPKVLVFRDSFAWQLIPTLSEQFQSAVYVWTHSFLPELVEREKPDIVVLECVERYIDRLTLANPERVRAEIRRK